MNENLLSTASDCIDLIQKRRRINESVTSQFMTNIIDINKQTLESLQPSHLQEEMKTSDVSSTAPTEEINYRFIKPSKYFYNSIMGLWLKFDQKRLASLTFEEFLDYLRKHSSLASQSSDQETLTASQIGPIHQFFLTLKNEWSRMQESQQELSYYDFFNQVKSKMF